MSLDPGLGIVKGMALTLRRFFEPKVTVMYPEVRADVSPQVPRPAAAALRRVGHAQVRDVLPVRPGLPDRVHRHGRHGHRGRYHVHWGAPETYGERREESALRGPAGPCRTRPIGRSSAVDLREVDAILDDYDHDPAQMLAILEATQAAYGYLPVAALKRISQRTGAWYAMIYGTATYYAHLRFEPADGDRSGRRDGERHRPAEAATWRRSAPPSSGGGRASGAEA